MSRPMTYSEISTLDEAYENYLDDYEEDDINGSITI